MVNSHGSQNACRIYQMLLLHFINTAFKGSGSSDVFSSILAWKGTLKNIAWELEAAKYADLGRTEYA